MQIADHGGCATPHLRTPNNDAQGANTPAPIRQYRSARFWDNLAERYARSPVADEAAYHRKLQVTQDHLGPEMKVFEFGCGTGSTALEHARHVEHIHAIDISSKMIEIAQRKADEAGVANVTFEQSTLDDFNAPDEHFDVVLGLSILHLLADEGAAISRAHRLLKPGGIFVSSTACLGDWLRYIKYVAPIGRFLGVLPLINVFTSEELRSTLEATGFQIEHHWQPDRRKALFLVARKPT